MKYFPRGAGVAVGALVAVTGVGGVLVGLRVAVLVGVRLGVLVGVMVGVRLGVLVGRGVNVFVGVRVGFCVGPLVGGVPEGHPVRLGAGMYAACSVIARLG